MAENYLIRQLSVPEFGPTRHHSAMYIAASFYFPLHISTAAAASIERCSAPPYPSSDTTVSPSSILHPLSSAISRPGTTPLVTAALGNHLPWLPYTDTCYCILHPASPIPRLLLCHLFLPLFFSFHLPLRKASGKSSCVSQLKTPLVQVRILLRTVTIVG